MLLMNTFNYKSFGQVGILDIITVIGVSIVYFVFVMIVVLAIYTVIDLMNKNTYSYKISRSLFFILVIPITILATYGFYEGVDKVLGIDQKRVDVFKLDIVATDYNVEVIRGD